MAKRLKAKMICLKTRQMRRTTTKTTRRRRRNQASRVESDMRIKRPRKCFSKLALLICRSENKKSRKKQGKDGKPKSQRRKRNEKSNSQRRVNSFMPIASNLDTLSTFSLSIWCLLSSESVSIHSQFYSLCLVDLPVE